MKDQLKTKQELIKELSSLSQKAAELEREEIRRKKTEKDLQESEEYFRSLIDKSPDAHLMMDEGGFYVDCNPAALDMLRMTSRDQLLGSTPADLSPERQPDGRLSRDKAQTMITEIKARGSHRFEWVHRRADGEAFFAEVLANVLLYHGKPLFHAVWHDISDRKRAETALKESETLYNAVMTNLPVGMIIVDSLTRRIESVNKAASALFGAPEEKILGHRCHSFLCPANEKACPILDLGKIIENTEREMICADGNRSPVLKSVIRIKVQGREKLLECFIDIAERKRAEEESRRSLEKLREAFQGIIQVISSMLEKRDPYTSGHQKRVAELARAIGEEMGISPDRVIGLQMAGSIHDIGKISIPSEILSKPTRLTKFEYELIQTHSQSGRDILRDIEFPWPIAEMILQHHERMDGTGYPRGLKGEEILLEARILAVSDIVEAMASHRPYRVALGIETALEEIEKNIGIAYDIDVAKACLRLFREKGYCLVG